MMIILREVAKLILILTPGGALLCFVSKQDLPGDTFKVSFKCVLTKDTSEGGMFSSCASWREFYTVRFSKDVNDMYCRIGKTMRQASNMHPNLTLAVAQKI